MEIKLNDLLHKIKKIPFMAGFDENFLIDFTAFVDLRFFKKNELICEEGEYEEACCIVLFGSVGLWIKNKYGKSVEVDTLGFGEIFGEVAALSGNPRIASVISNESSEILYLDKKALFALMDASQEIRNIVNKRYRERLLRTELKKIKIFDGLPDAFFRELTECVDLITYKMDETVVSFGEDYSDFFIIIYGFAKVLVPRFEKTDSRSAGKSNSQSQSDQQEKNKEFKIAAYLPPGQYFGEVGFIEKRKRTATVIALTRLELIKISQIEFNSILSKYCDAKSLFEKVVANRKRQVIKLSENEAQGKLMDWIVSSNIIQTKAVLLIDMNKCVRCETCIDTCERLYGTSRLSLNGFKYENLLIPASCRHCHEPYCLVGCPTGAISRDFSGEVYHNNTCIGCGNCAKNCPFGNISIVDRNEKRYKPSVINKLFFKNHSKNDTRGVSVRIIDIKSENSGKPYKDQKKHRKAPLKIAAKCDNCKNFPYMGCVRNCPRGAAQRVNPREYFKELMLV